MKPEITEFKPQTNPETLVLTYKHYDEPLDEDFITLCKKDYKEMKYKVDLDTTDTMKSVLLPQSLQGHAMQGHMGFSSTNPETKNTILYMAGKAGLEPSQTKGKKVIVRYPNTSIEDILEAIYNNKSEVEMKKNFRQQVIDEVFQYVDRIAAYEKNKQSQSDMRLHRLCNDQGESLMRIGLFGPYTIINNPLNVIIGMYLGSKLDSAKWRAETEKVFPGIQLHKGESYAVDRRKMKEQGLTLQDLANAGDSSIAQDKINRVISNKKLVKSSRRNVCGYVEESQGFGVSDDAAWNYISLLYGVEAGFGFTLVDSIDTMDKCTPDILKGGQDEYLGEYIEKAFKNYWIGIEPRDIHNLIYASSVDNENKQRYPSSSMRRFLEFNKDKYNTLLSHMAFVKGIKNKCYGNLNPPKKDIAFKQVDNGKFYNELKKRAETLVKSGRMDYSSGHKQNLIATYTK